jgi:VanZ family protein
MPTRRSLLTYISAYLPAVVWAVFIYALSAQSVLPGIYVSGLDFVFKKSAHMFVYAVLFILLQGAAVKTLPQNQSQSYSSARLWVLPAILSLMYSAIDELHQTFVPGRYGTFRDIGFDMVGVLIAFLKRYGYI